MNSSGKLVSGKPTKRGVMPVRGSTAWQHARVQKLIINRDEGGDGRVTGSGTHYVLCAWLDCSNNATEIFKVRVNTAQQGYEDRYMNYAFCSERCKEHWLDDWRRNRV
jgi:hypothetical protein